MAWMNSCLSLNTLQRLQLIRIKEEVRLVSILSFNRINRMPLHIVIWLVKATILHTWCPLNLPWTRVALLTMVVMACMLQGLKITIIKDPLHKHSIIKCHLSYLDSKWLVTDSIILLAMTGNQPQHLLQEVNLEVISRKTIVLKTLLASLEITCLVIGQIGTPRVVVWLQFLCRDRQLILKGMLKKLEAVWPY